MACVRREKKYRTQQWAPTRKFEFTENATQDNCLVSTLVENTCWFCSNPRRADGDLSLQCARSFLIVIIAKLQQLFSRDVHRLTVQAYYEYVDRVYCRDGHDEDGRVVDLGFSLTTTPTTRDYEKRWRRQAAVYYCGRDAAETSDTSIGGGGNR